MDRSWDALGLDDYVSRKVVVSQTTKGRVCPPSEITAAWNRTGHPWDLAGHAPARVAGVDSRGDTANAPKADKHGPQVAQLSLYSNVPVTQVQGTNVNQ